MTTRWLDLSSTGNSMAKLGPGNAAWKSGAIMDGWNTQTGLDSHLKPEEVRCLSARIDQLELLIAELLIKNQQLRFSLDRNDPGISSDHK